MEDKIVKEKEKIFPDLVIYETDHFKVAQDWEIALPGFFILSAKRKIRSILDFSKEESMNYIETKLRIRRAMKEVLGIDIVYFFQNEDSASGFHVWILPIYKWMKKLSKRGPGLLVPVWSYAKENMNTKKDIQATKEAAEKMIEYFKRD